MQHIKSKHKNSNPCQNFKKKQCRFTEESCWFSHNTSNNSQDNINNSVKSGDITPNQKSDFCQSPINLAPPIPQSTQQIVTTMINMLNQMLTNISQQ